MKVKLIKGFGGFYCVSDTGIVWTRHPVGDHRNKEIKGKWKRRKLYTCKAGHLALVLKFNGNSSRCLVHRLVLETFVGPCPERMQCRHLDGNPTNNHVFNLKWGTSKENSEDMIRHGTVNSGERNGESKLTKNEVIEIRRLYSTKKYTQYKLSEIFDISRTQIGRIVNKKRWKYIK